MISGRGNDQGKYHELVKEFLFSVGNIAPIPFSLNRSKSDDPPREYLGDLNDDVFVTRTGNEDFYNFPPADSLEKDKILAFSFAKIAATRLTVIYNNWFKLPIARFVDFSGIDDKRNNLYKKLIENNPNFQITYVIPNGRQARLQYPCDWARGWLACGQTGRIVMKGESFRCYVCVASNGEQFEIGIRRHPQDIAIDGDTNKWWFKCNDISFDKISDVDKVQMLMNDLYQQWQFQPETDAIAHLT